MKTILTLFICLVSALTINGQIVRDTTYTPYETNGDTIWEMQVDSFVTYQQWPIVNPEGEAIPVAIGVDSLTGLTLYRQFEELKATTTHIEVRYSEFYMVNGVKLPITYKSYRDDEFRTYHWNSTIGLTIILPAINQRLQNL